LIPSVATLLVLALLLWLGAWQLDRAEQKLRLRALTVQAMAGDAWPDLGPHELARARLYQRVQMRGRYDGAHQFLLDNITHNGVAGYHVLTPFIGRGDESAVLVNRGWIKADLRREVLPDIALVQHTDRVRGLIVPLPRTFVLGEELGYEAPGWPRVIQRIEIGKMAPLLGHPVAGLVMRLDRGEPDGFVRQWRAFPGISPERHKGYALQWFSLAFALVVIYIVVNTHGERERGGNDV